MKSQNLSEFWILYRTLPAEVRSRARQAYALFREDPDHPSLHFKKLNGPGSYWSVRFGNGYRAVGQREGNTITWFWIGSHQAFDKLF